MHTLICETSLLDQTGEYATPTPYLSNLSNFCNLLYKQLMNDAQNYRSRRWNPDIDLRQVSLLQIFTLYLDISVNYLLQDASHEPRAATSIWYGFCIHRINWIPRRLRIDNSALQKPKWKLCATLNIKLKVFLVSCYVFWLYLNFTLSF